MISIYSVGFFIHELSRAAFKYNFVFSTIKTLQDSAYSYAVPRDTLVVYATDTFDVDCSVEKLVDLGKLSQGQSVDDVRAYAHDIAAQIRQSLDDQIVRKKLNKLAIINSVYGITATNVSNKIEKGEENMVNDPHSSIKITASGISICPGLTGVPKIKDVIFNDPATIVFWTDGTKTVVKAQNEDFDPEKGLAMAFFKKMHGNKGHYFEEIKKWTEKYEPPKLSESALREVLRKAADGYKGIGAARSRNDILDDLFGPRNADDDE